MQFIQLPDISITPTVDEPIFTVAPVTAPQLGGANEHATAASPDVSAQPTKTELERLFDDAEAAAQRGDWASSLTLFDEMVRRHPTFGPGYVGLASAAFATGQVQAGAVALEHACGIYPDNADLRTQLGVALAHSGRLQEAQAKFLEVLDIDAKNIDAIVSLAHLCRASRNFVEAVDLLDHAEQLAPKSPLVLGAIGATALELGDRAGAETTLAHLRTVAPDHAETQHLAASIAAFGG